MDPIDKSKVERGEREGERERDGGWQWDQMTKLQWEVKRGERERPFHYHFEPFLGTSIYWVIHKP